MGKHYIQDIVDITREMSFENEGQYREIIYLLDQAKAKLAEKLEDDEYDH